MTKNLISLLYKIFLLNFITKSISREASLAIFLTFILILSVPLLGAFASSKSPYESGYDHGCDDAGISDPSNRYINQPEKGPSFHTSEFMNGYNNGYDSCSNDFNSERTYQYDSSAQSRSQGTTIEDLCNQYHNALQLNGPCSDYVQGNELQGPGAFFIACNLIKLGVSTTGPLGALLLAVPCG